MINFRVSFISVTFLSVLAPSVVYAGVDSIYDETQESHFYVGTRVGWNYIEDACENNTIDCNEDTVGAGIYGGYQWKKWLAFEGGTTYYGDPDATYSGRHKVEVDLWGIDVSTKLSYLITPKWGLYTRLGAVYIDIDKESDFEKKESANTWNVLTTVGVDYRVAPQWSVRAEYQFIDGIGESDTLRADMHFTSLGLTYHFGM